MNPFSAYEQVEAQANAERLKRKVRNAIAWGIPDGESAGLAAHEFVQVLGELLRYCESLERRLQQ